jgi:4-amino-4-deoxy-L-arabinose transferase-like glycosyltransferase
MPPSLAPAEVVSPRRRPLGLELALVVLVAAVVLIPGIWRYSLVDPWETHYGEVAREMLENNDFVHTKWRGTMEGNPGDNEGFRSKPVLMFWMMAAGMRVMGVGEDGGYSGEMTESARVMVGIRLPFLLAAIAGLALMWFMFARLVSRRMAWLALLVVGSTPMFCMIARNAIPDMPMVACTIGAISMFLMAMEDGERPISTITKMFKGRFTLDARHVVLGIALGFVLGQALYYCGYFIGSPQLAVRMRMPTPALWIPLWMVVFAGGMSRDGFLIVRLPFVLLGGVIAAIVNEPMPRRRPDQTLWRHIFDDILFVWDRHAVDRYILRGIAYPVAWAARFSPSAWADTAIFADHVLQVRPLTTMRQVYLLACYFLLGVCLLAKGPPGFTVVGAVGAFYVISFGRWRQLWDGAFELKRGLLLIVAIALPWHIAMFLKEGQGFINEYFFTHILNRASANPDKSLGTFEYYTSQLGHGMWLWAALLPAAFGTALFRARQDTREGRVRFVIALWAIVSVALFCLVQTKFHHYILPAIPPLALLVAFLLDDLYGKRERLHPLYAALGSGIVLLVCRDLMHEPERWIEMFVFRYDRPWPGGEPWQVDPSDGFLALGLVAAIAIPFAATRFTRLGVIMIGAAGLAIAIWALQVYMPNAGTHWGMRDAVRTYYEQRTVYGQKLVYFGERQLHDEWRGVKDKWTFDTFIPDTLQVGQPMTITVQLNKATDERIMEQELVLHGSATAIGKHSIEVTLAPGERAKLDPLIQRGANARPGVRPRIRVVDADKLFGWQLYWRGENFWSGGEIWGWLPEMKTSLNKTDNVQFKKYIEDRTKAPLGRRYFVVTEAGRVTSIRGILPERGKQSFEVLDTTSNKFSLGAFFL